MRLHLVYRILVHTDKLTEFGFFGTYCHISASNLNKSIHHIIPQFVKNLKKEPGRGLYKRQQNVVKCSYHRILGGTENAVELDGGKNGPVAPARH